MRRNDTSKGGRVAGGPERQLLHRSSSSVSRPVHTLPQAAGRIELNILHYSYILHYH